MFKNKKLEVKIVDEKKTESITSTPTTYPTAEQVDAAKQILVGGAVLFLAKLLVDATTEIAVASIITK